VSPLVERVTDAAVFDRKLIVAAVDASGGGVRQRLRSGQFRLDRLPDQDRYVLKDTRTANTLNAFTYCLDKSG